MAGVAEIEIERPTSEIDDVFPTVQIIRFDENGEPDIQVAPNINCLNITQSLGIVPGTATIRVANTEKEVTAKDLTLKYAPMDLKLGTRIRVMDEDQQVCLFLGQVMIRQDQGATCEVRYTALDDRFFLSKIPVRGCLVYDKDGESTYNVKFIPRYINRTNPGGNLNCVGCKIQGEDGNDYIYPIFAQTAMYGQAYRSEEDYYAQPLKEGVVTAWTPRRYLQYLQLLANIEGNDTSPFYIDGCRSDQWRSLSKLVNSRRLGWDKSSVDGLRGEDPNRYDYRTGNDIDPLDKKMPDVNFQGVMLGAAIDKVLKIAGTHELTIALTQKTGYEIETEVRTSSIKFVPIGYSGSLEGLSKSIDLVVAGNMRDTPTSAYDFDLTEDATQATTAVLVEGNPVVVETELFYDKSDPDSSSIKPAWTAKDEEVFKAIIEGKDDVPTSEGTDSVAIYPRWQGDEDIDNFLTADGLAGRDLILAKDITAVNLARSVKPEVFRGFYVDSWILSQTLHNGKKITNGVDDAFADQQKYPVLRGSETKDKYRRPIKPEQEQFVINKLDDNDVMGSRTVNKYPIRLRIDNGESFQESLWLKGLKQTPDGTIYLDGCVETMNDKNELCIYSGDLVLEPEVVELKSFKINCAFSLDHRVNAYETREIPRLDANFVTDAINGQPLMYIDSMGAYNEVHQVESDPAAMPQFLDGNNKMTTPLYRILPPGSEERDAISAARRKLAQNGYVIKKSSWKFPGIRMSWKPGLWVDSVKLVDGTNAPGYYIIYAPVKMCSYDFEAQITEVGGIITNFG